MVHAVAGVTVPWVHSSFVLSPIFAKRGGMLANLNSKYPCTLRCREVATAPNQPKKEFSLALIDDLPRANI